MTTRGQSRCTDKPMEPIALLANESLRVDGDASLTITLIEVTDRALRVRCRVDGTYSADQIAVAPADAVRALAGNGRAYRWATSHIGGTGMEDVVDWIFDRDDSTRPERVTITAASTVEVDVPDETSTRAAHP